MGIAALSDYDRRLRHGHGADGLSAPRAWTPTATPRTARALGPPARALRRSALATAWASLRFLTMTGGFDTATALMASPRRVRGRRRLRLALRARWVPPRVRCGAAPSQPHGHRCAF